MDELELYELLKSFQRWQFVDLRRRLGLGAQQVPPAGTPQETADRFIEFIKLRDQGDLSALIKAALAAVDRVAPPAPPPPATSAAPPSVTQPTDRRPRLLILAANSSTTTRLK